MHIELTFTAPRYSHFPAELSLIDLALFQIAERAFEAHRKRIA